MTTRRLCHLVTPSPCHPHNDKVTTWQGDKVNRDRCHSERTREESKPPGIETVEILRSAQNDNPPPLSPCHPLTPPALSEVEGPALSEVEGPALSEVEGS